MAKFTLQPVKIASDSEDENGVLVLADGRLVVVLSKLQAAFHGEDHGRWYIEAGFGRCDVSPPPPFENLPDALRWVAGRLGLADPDLTAAEVSFAGIPDGIEPN